MPGLQLLACATEVQELKDKLTTAEQRINQLENDLDTAYQGLLRGRDNDTTSRARCEIFSVYSVRNSSVNGLFKYYTGFEYVEFCNLCVVFKVPIDPQDHTSPLTYTQSIRASKMLPLVDQLFMVLCKLRNNFDTIDLGYRFGISQPDVSVLFNSWINYMFFCLADIPIWPHRNIIQSKMPEMYKHDFPTTISIIDCTEIKIQKPYSLKLQVSVTLTINLLLLLKQLLLVIQ